MVEFKAHARRDAYQRMESELQALLATAPDDRKEVRQSRELIATKLMNDCKHIIFTICINEGTT